MLWFQTRSISKAGAECWELCKMHQTRFLCWPVLRIMIRLLKPFCLHIIWIIINVKISDVSWTPGVLESLNLETLQLESRKIPKDQFSVSGYSRESSCRRFVSRVVPHLVRIVSNWLKGEKDKPLRLGSGGWCLAWWTCHLYPAHPVFETFSSHCWLLNVQCTLLYTFFYYKAAQSWKRKQGHLKQQFPFHPQVLHQAQCFPVQQNGYHYYRK